MLPKCAVWLLAKVRLFPSQTESAISIALGPEMRTTAMPPMPGGVEIAQMVESDDERGEVVTDVLYSTSENFSEIQQLIQYHRGERKKSHTR